MKNTQKFTQNWQQYHAQFGQSLAPTEPDFIYYIEASLPLQTAQTLYQYGQNFKQLHQFSDGRWLEPEQLHLTITLPGRLGTHFQKNDLPFMKNTLQAVAQQTPAFDLQIEGFNVFPQTLFAQVFDDSGRLQQLHETLCNEIPFSQHPEFRYAHYLPHVSLGYELQTVAPLKPDTDCTFPPLDFRLETLVLGRAKWDGAQLKKIESARYQLCPN